MSRVARFEAAGCNPKKGVKVYRFPHGCQRDDEAVLNPSCRGMTGQLVASGSFLGVEPITGKPSKSAREGKNERLD